MNSTRNALSVPDDGFWTYAIATPDAVLGGTLPWIMDRLRRHDLTPTACQLLRLDVQRMKQFYGGGNRFLISNPNEKNYEFSWDVHAALYEIAPACIFMLSREAGRATEAMLTCKGATRPEIADPDSIRSLGENVVFNLLHCPDDAISAHRELAVLFGDDAARLLAFAAPCNTRYADLSRLVGVRTLLDSIPIFSGPEAISFPFIVNRVRLRVIQALALALCDDRMAIDFLTSARRQLSAERRRLRELPRSLDRLHAARAANRLIHEPLAKAARQFPDCIIGAGIDALSSLYDLHGQRELKTVFSFADRGIYLAPLEKIIIESHGHSFQPNREIDGIYC